MIVEGKLTGSLFNVPALLVVMVLSWILVRGVKESAGANNVMVAIKIAAVLFFIFGAARRGASLEPAPVSAQRMAGGAQRGRHRLLYIHRI